MSTSSVDGSRGLRAFVAVDIPSRQVLDELVAFQGEIAKSGADVKLVESENLHFTVRFMGEITDEQARNADQRLRSLRLTGLEVTVAGVGAFPSESRPNVVWAGVAADDAASVTSVATTAIRHSRRHRGKRRQDVPAPHNPGQNQIREEQSGTSISDSDECHEGLRTR